MATSALNETEKQVIEDLVLATFSKENVALLEAGLEREKIKMKVEQIFASENTDGTTVYSAQEVGDLLALMVLSSKSKVELKGQLPVILGGFFKRAGLTNDMDRAGTHRAIHAYLAKTPLNPSLLERFRALVGEDFASGLTEKAAKHYNKFTDRHIARPKHMDDKGPAGAQGFEAVVDEVGKNIKG